MSETEQTPKEETPVEVEEVVEIIDEPKEDEPMKEETPEVVKGEKEEDEPENNGERFTDTMMMSSYDGTLNVIVSGNSVVAPLPTEGVTLLAACRANVGINSGCRYLVEFEVIQCQNQPEIRVGFSMDSSSVFLGQAQSLCFTSNGQCISNGENVSPFRGRRFQRGDVVGLVVNRTESGNANTVSLFLNGLRIGDAVPIPESFDGALYPHVSVRNAIVNVNFRKTVLSELPFKVRPIGDALQEHITKTVINDVKEAKVIVPFGLKTKEMIEEYIVGHSDETFTEITRDFLNTWQEKSGVGKGGSLSDETIRAFIKLMTLRKRNYIFGSQHFMVSKDRSEFCENFCGSVKKIALVSSTIIEKLPNNLKFHSDVTLPTKEEGFTAVEYTTKETDCKEALNKWQKICKLATKVEDLKCGEWFKTELDKYEKMRESTKAHNLKKRREAAKIAAAAAKAERDAAEGKDPEPPKEEEPKPEDEKKDATVVDPSAVDTMEFCEEDWMLCDLRVEAHLLLHAFRTDVEDKERVGFVPEHLPFYYRHYFNGQRSFATSTYGCSTVAEAFEIIPETVAIEDGMLVPQVDMKADLDEIVQQTEDARQERIDRIGAGDEGANLKFRARDRRPKGNNKGKGKGGRDNRDNRDFRGDNRGFDRRIERPPRVVEPPRAFSQGKGRSEGYQMRPIPGMSAGGMKRPGGGGPPPKRMR